MRIIMVDKKILVAIIAAYMYELSKRRYRFNRDKVVRPIKIDSWRIASRMDILRGRL